MRKQATKKKAARKRSAATAGLPASSARKLQAKLATAERYGRAQANSLEAEREAHRETLRTLTKADGQTRGAIAEMNERGRRLQTIDDLAGRIEELILGSVGGAPGALVTMGRVSEIAYQLRLISAPSDQVRRQRAEEGGEICNFEAPSR